MSPQATGLDIDDVVDTRDYYSRIRVWPQIPAVVRPRQWLANFLPDELPIATALLDAFLYYNSEMTDRLFVSSFHNLSSIVAGGATYNAWRTEWRRFLARVLVTHPTGDPPSVTDSGHLFDRKARQLLGLDEERILAPAETLERLVRRGPAPVVFVDDIAGSGVQFVSTWQRPYPCPGGPTSFESLAAGGGLVDAYYCAAVCTERAWNAIAVAAPSVRICPAHLLPERYGASHPDSLLFRSELLPDVQRVVLAASARAGVTSGREFGWHSLGLAVAFEHSVPDGTIPLFYSERANWTPLVRRR